MNFLNTTFAVVLISSFSHSSFGATYSNKCLKLISDSNLKVVLDSNSKYSASNSPLNRWSGINVQTKDNKIALEIDPTQKLSKFARAMYNTISKDLRTAKGESLSIPIPGNKVHKVALSGDGRFVGLIVEKNLLLEVESLLKVPLEGAPQINKHYFLLTFDFANGSFRHFTGQPSKTWSQESVSTPFLDLGPTTLRHSPSDRVKRTVPSLGFFESTTGDSLIALSIKDPALGSDEVGPFTIAFSKSFMNSVLPSVTHRPLSWDYNNKVLKLNIDLGRPPETSATSERIEFSLNNEVDLNPTDRLSNLFHQQTSDKVRKKMESLENARVEDSQAERARTKALQDRLAALNKRFLDETLLSDSYLVDEFITLIRKLEPKRLEETRDPVRQPYRTRDVHYRIDGEYFTTITYDEEGY